MAENFRIFIHKNSDSLHLKLSGDFDGSSAYELLNSLKQNFSGISKIFIHTSCLKTVHPFGLAIFHKNIGALNAKAVSFLITGQDAARLIPEKRGKFQVLPC